MTKRFIELGSTHIKDNSTGDEYYAPCEHKLCDLLNELSEENEQLKLDLKVERDGGNLYKDLCEALEKENEQLKKKLFEARKDYLIETADISDKLYLDEMIEEERKEIFE